MYPPRRQHRTQHNHVPGGRRVQVRPGGIWAPERFGHRQNPHNQTRTTKPAQPNPHDQTRTTASTTSLPHDTLRRSQLVSAHGFAWVNEGTAAKPKPGYVATQPGSRLRLRVDTDRSSLGSPPGERVALYLHHLRSYQHMGTAALR